MEQQDFWKWAEQRADDRRPSQKKGRLKLSELPPDLRLSIPQVQKLHKELGQRLGAVELILTDNRRRMVTVRKIKGGHRLRVHHMFVGCGDETLDALSKLARGKKGVDRARQVIKEYIADHRSKISFDVDPDKLEADGEHHDLQTMLDKWRTRLEDPILSDVVITWGRDGKGQRTIRFGSYDFDRKLIRMHPALDEKWVPGFFVEFIVYHELLHALYPPVEETSSRRVVHTDEFRKMEREFPLYEKAMTWERKNLPRFLER